MSATVIGQIVHALANMPPDVIRGIGSVVSRILAGDSAGAKAEAEKAAVLAASKATFRETAKRAKAARK